MAQLSQQARPLVALALVVLLLVLVCVGSAIVGGGGGISGPDGDDGTAGPAGSAGDSPEWSPGSEGSLGSEDRKEGVTSYSSERSLADEASGLLEAYRDRGECVLREAGFLDLFGNAWTCTVQGPGWVDVCLVSGDAASRDGASRSDVRVVHMRADEWERAYGQAMG